MANRIDTEVSIGGKTFTISGNESEEYLQKVAAYINRKKNEYEKVEAFTRQPIDIQSILLQINIADDFFKEQKKNVDFLSDIEAKDKEIYDLKHEIITAQIKLENTEKTIKQLEREVVERDKKIIKLEA